MYVQKRGNRGLESVCFDKVTARLRGLRRNLAVDHTRIAQETIANMINGISTEEIDCISAQKAEAHKIDHPDYGIFAARILVSNLHKNTPRKFSECMELIYKTVPHFRSDNHMAFVRKHADELNAMIIDDNDYLFDYVGFKTMEKQYLVIDKREKARTRTIDRPQYAFMREAICLNIDRSADVLVRIKLCYKLFSQLYYTHATPTLKNACSKVQQLNSCFLLGMSDDAEGIMQTITNCALISKRCGGIAVNVANLRCANEAIVGTNGSTKGIEHFIRILDRVADAFNQGGDRPGAIAIYLTPHHGDVLGFLQLKLQQGKPENRARTLNYAMWMPDLFIAQCIANGDWHLFTENRQPGLNEVFDGMFVCKNCHFCYNPAYNKYVRPAMQRCTDPCEWERRDAFIELYNRYVADGNFVRKLPAIKVMDAITACMRDAGQPYICAKDVVNRCSQQQAIGTIQCSNLCTEIMEYSSPDSYACCALASICVQRFVIEHGDKIEFDYAKLMDVVGVVTENLDHTIDINAYSVMECIDNAQQYRPIAMGIQGLADLFIMMRLPYLSPEAAELDAHIAETIYFAAVTRSCDLAARHGAHVGFEGSPAWMGFLQPDLWMEEYARRNKGAICDPRWRNADGSLHYDWDALKQRIRKVGLRNSLVTANMPTVTTSQSMCSSESFEPRTSVAYVRGAKIGSYLILNEPFVRDMIDKGAWTREMQDEVTRAGGRLDAIDGIDSATRDIYRSVYDMKQNVLMDRAAIRGAFVDQSQSFNLHISDNSDPVLRGIIYNGYNKGLKTIDYYTRTAPAAQPIRAEVKRMAACEASCTECSA